jgi:DNA-binding beta-propeller fold protein YncE
MMRRLPALLLFLVLLGAAPAARADLVYVLNSGDASISLLDAAARTELRRMPTLREPHHLTLTPDRRFLVVADSGGNELMFLNPASGEVVRRERLSNPYHLEYSPNGRLLVIASLRRDQVDIYDARAGSDQPLTLLQRLRPGDKPSHIAFSPDSRTVYVTLQGDRAVVAIDLQTREILWHAQVGPEPAGILYHEVPGQGPRLLVGIMGADHFAVLNPETRQVERTIPIGRGAHTVFKDPEGRTIWGTSRVDSRLLAIDPATLEPRRVVEIPGGPDDLAFDPDGRVWMTLRWVGRVGVFDPVAGTVETVRVGRSPHGIFIHPRRTATAPPVAGLPPVALPLAMHAAPGVLPASAPAR